MPLASFAGTRRIAGPMQSIRHNGYPTMRIAGDAAPGVGTGEAMMEMERLAGANAVYLLFGFSLRAAFLCLAAL